VAKSVIVVRSVIESVLNHARFVHPKEGILLLKGRVKKDRVLVDEIEVPPLAVHSRNFANFPLHMLPIDFSIVGTAHSHPSGVLRPSIGDLNNFFGMIMIIAAYPYISERQMAVFDRDGRTLGYEIADREEDKQAKYQRNQTSRDTGS